MQLRSILSKCFRAIPQNMLVPITNNASDYGVKYFDDYFRDIERWEDEGGRIAGHQ